VWNDVEALREIARRLQGFADIVGESANNAETSDAGWVSTAADQYRDRVDRAVSTLRTRSGEISEASTAMFTYANTVEGHIADVVLLASTLQMGVDYVWGRVQDGVSDVDDLRRNLIDGAEDVLEDIGGAASRTLNNLTGWL
jgi:hypothetical protein